MNCYFYTNMKNRVIIIGGGLAGLVAGIHLSKSGIEVLIFEKNSFPKHKVCGEYISNEVKPYLESLKIDMESLQPTTINKLEFSLSSGKAQKAILPLGGFGISRYKLDDYLFKLATSVGCTIIKESVDTIDFSNNLFTVKTSKEATYHSEIVLGAFGKRSNIDQSMKRSFMSKNAPWLAVKCHYKGCFDNDLVGLHNFEGGYCGVSKVENDIINICYITDYKSFKKYKDIATFEQKIVKQNPNLKQIFEQIVPLFEKPLTISQISFEDKKAVENHVLMIGDTAGLIHPLCGNGMSIAIHSAKLASEAVIDYFNGKIKNRVELEYNYQKSWNYNFKKRIFFGKLISKLLQQPEMANVLMKLLLLFPFLLTAIIKNTHGKPLQSVKF
jgi:flavin-dependent dehydrogenase